MSWRVAKSLITLREQVDEAAPDRVITSDGTIGDTSHSARKSDHNPNAAGVVCAMDITHDPRHGVDTYTFADHLRDIKDKRIKYVISNGRIWNPSVNSAWRKYTGSNKHDLHVHISVNARNCDDTSPWDIGEIGHKDFALPSGEVAEGGIDKIITEHPTIRKGASGEAVKKLQHLLNIVEDGSFGAMTERAVMAFQLALKMEVDGVVGPYTWQALLGMPEPVKPSDPETKTQKNIKATVFGGTSEVEKSAYSGKRIGTKELVVALPWRFTGRRPKVLVVNRANGVGAEATIEDVGPWNVDDDYWTKGRRPQAESGRCVSGPNKGRRTNMAGIDLSPALAEQIDIHGIGYVDWSFV